MGKQIVNQGAPQRAKSGGDAVELPPRQPSAEPGQEQRDSQREAQGSQDDMTLDQAAARRWLVRVIAARAVELYRQRSERQTANDVDRHPDAESDSDDPTINPPSRSHTDGGRRSSTASARAP